MHLDVGIPVRGQDGARSVRVRRPNQRRCAQPDGAVVGQQRPVGDQLVPVGRRREVGGLLRADQKFYRAGTLPAGLASYLRAAWQRATETIKARADAPRKILFLHDAGLFARYADAGGHDALTTLQQAARRPADRPYGMWLLCPSEAPRKAPNLDGWTVEAIGAAEWSILDNAYLDSLKSVPPVRKA